MFGIRMDVYHHMGERDDVVSLLHKVIAQLEKVMATQAELVVEVNALKDQVTKIGTETSTLLTKINDLLAIIAAGPVSTELQAAVDSLKAQVQVVDDLVPDAPAPTS